jgi:hypothetical protein
VRVKRRRGEREKSKNEREKAKRMGHKRTCGFSYYELN